MTSDSISETGDQSLESKMGGMNPALRRSIFFSVLKNRAKQKFETYWRSLNYSRFLNNNINMPISAGLSADPHSRDLKGIVIKSPDGRDRYSVAHYLNGPNSAIMYTPIRLEDVVSLRTNGFSDELKLSTRDADFHDKGRPIYRLEDLNQAMAHLYASRAH